MFRVEKKIALSVAGHDYSGTLKIVAEKWCYVNESGRYFKIFYTDQTKKISYIGDRLYELPLQRLNMQLQHLVAEASR